MTWLQTIVADAHLKLLALRADHPARVYLRSRGVTDADVLQYQIGWFDSPHGLERCTQDFFNWLARYGWDRLCFPLLDGLGQPFGILLREPTAGGRTREWLMVRPELQPPLYGLHVGLPAAFASQRAVVVEGVFDYFAVKPYAPDTMALLTSRVSNTVRRLLSRYVTRVVALMDMDAPGRRGAYWLAGVIPPIQYQKPDDPIRKGPPTPPFLVHVPAYTAHDPSDLYAAGKLDELRRLAVLGR